MSGAGLRFRVWGLGFRGYGSGFRGQGPVHWELRQGLGLGLRVVMENSGSSWGLPADLRMLGPQTPNPKPQNPKTPNPKP